jgi:hypothetical protein
MFASAEGLGRVLRWMVDEGLVLSDPGIDLTVDPILQRPVAFHRGLIVERVETTNGARTVIGHTAAITTWFAWFDGASDTVVSGHANGVNDSTTDAYRSRAALFDHAQAADETRS